MNNSEQIKKGLTKPLSIQEVDFRIKSVSKTGKAQILAYKDARVDMNRLDDVCGLNWQDKYEIIDGQLFCSIGILVGDQWIWRGDVGEEPSSGRDVAKGRASDAFKRAAFKWGIGRELYDYPKIWVQLNDNEYQVNGDKVRANSWALEGWTWEVKISEGSVESLIGKDKNGILRYNNGKKIGVGAPSGNAGGGQVVSAAARSPQKNDKPWLNKTVKGTRELTREWNNIVAKFNTGKIKQVADVEKHYKISKATKEELNQLFKFSPKTITQ